MRETTVSYTHLDVYKRQQPDILVCRTEHELSAEIKNKISYLCNITPGCVIENNDVKTIYEVPLMLEREGLCVKALEKLGLPDRAHDLSDWRDMVQHIICLLYTSRCV